MQDKTDKITRIKILLSELGISQRQLSKKTGISTSAISQYATGERDISVQSALEITREFPNVNIEWLLGKDVDMLLPKNKAEPPTDSQSRIAALEAELEKSRQDVRDIIQVMGGMAELVRNLSNKGGPDSDQPTKATFVKQKEQ